MDGWLDLETELGWIALGWSECGVRRIGFAGPERPDLDAASPPELVRVAADLLLRHLGGEAVDLAGIPLDLEGLSHFARRVLEALRGTRRGEVLTYGQLARVAGVPGAARAVGQVLARNPLPILIPCHRVVAAKGPGGFSLFGSLETKERLMALESMSR